MAARTSSFVHPNYKTKYAVTNWQEYEHGLRNRGDIMIWFSEDAIGRLDSSPTSQPRRATTLFWPRDLDRADAWNLVLSPAPPNRRLRRFIATWA